MMNLNIFCCRRTVSCFKVYAHFLLPIVITLDNSKAIVVLAHCKINTILGADVLACFKIRAYGGRNVFYETYVFHHNTYFFVFLKRHVLFTAATKQCRMTEWKIPRTGRGQFRCAWGNSKIKNILRGQMEREPNTEREASQF
jgi:hypothetical protein